MEPNVAIVTPYSREQPETIRRCLDAVRSQTVPVTHILVADGSPQAWIDGAGEADRIRHLKLDREHDSHPLAAMAIGAALAAGEEFDAVGLVTTDSVLDPDYVETCVETAEREYQLHFVLVEAHAGTPDGAPSPEDSIGSLFVLRRGYPSLPGLALVPAPLADLGYALILEKFRILEYHGVATDRPLVTRTNRDIPPMDAIRSWWNDLSEDQQQLIQKNIGGVISFTE